MVADRTVDDLIRQAASVLSEAMDEAAALALSAVDRYGAQLQPTCRRIAEAAGMPDAWNALRHRAQRLQKSRSEAPSGAHGDARQRIYSARHSMKTLDTESKAGLIREALESDPDLGIAVQAEIARHVRQPAAPQPAQPTKTLGFWANELDHIASTKRRISVDHPDEETARKLADGWIDLAQSVVAESIDAELASLIREAN